MRWLVATIGGLALVFGLACLNYTKAADWERHRAAAARRGWPAPSRSIYRLGVASTVLGAAGLGCAAGRGRRPRDAAS